MNEIGKKVIAAEKFYDNSFLNFDYQLADFGFETIKTFFKGESALELGPASGYMTRYLKDKFKELHLVEGSKFLLDKIPDYSNVVKFNSFFEDYDTKRVFDTIIMSHVLEHISDPVSILGRVKNWLKVNGSFIVSVPNAKSIHRLVAVEMGLLKSEYDLNARDHELGHYRVYDSQLLKQHVTEAGFKIVDEGGYFLKPVSNGQIESNWTKDMIDGFYKVGKRFQENCAEIYIVCSK